MEVDGEENKPGANRRHGMACIGGLPCAWNIGFYTHQVNSMTAREVNVISPFHKRIN